MIKSFYYNISFIILCASLLFVFTPLSTVVADNDVNTIPNDSIVTDDEIDNWLEKYATELRDSVMLPSINQKERKETVLPKIEKGNDAVQKPGTAINTPKFSVDANMQNIKTDKSAQIPIANEAVKSDNKKLVSAKPVSPSVKNGAKKNVKNSAKKSVENNNEIIKYASFLSHEDSLEIAENAKIMALRNPIFLDWVFGLPVSTSVAFDDSDSVIVDIRRHSHQYIRANFPELYSYHRNQLPAFSEINIGSLKNTKKDNMKLQVKGLNFNEDNIKIEKFKLQKWMRGAKFQAHLSQTYITPNWYKGGESNLAANFYVMGYYNYNDKKNIQWDNKIEWKLGVNSAGSDSLRWLRVNDDLLRINTKLGVKAFKSFYYTAEYDLQTQLFNTYKPNSYVRTTGPFSPLKMNLSLGMDYKYKNKLSIFLSPISYKLVYIADTVARHGIDRTENLAYQNGITDGKSSLNQLGGLLRINWAHNFNDAIGMEVKFYFFANYIGETKGVEIDSEIIGNFRINRYLSAKVSLNPRYDTTIILSDGTKPKFQFKEFISLGFNYIL